MPSPTTGELISQAFSTVGTIAALGGTVVATVYVWAKEHSTGRTACELMRKEIDKLKEDVRESKIDAEQALRLIARMEEDYKFLTQKMFGFFDRRHKREETD